MAKELNQLHIAMLNYSKYKCFTIKNWISWLQYLNDEFFHVSTFVEQQWLIFNAMTNQHAFPKTIQQHSMQRMLLDQLFINIHFWSFINKQYNHCWFECETCQKCEQQINLNEKLRQKCVLRFYRYRYDAVVFFGWFYFEFVRHTKFRCSGRYSYHRINRGARSSAWNRDSHSIFCSKIKINLYEYLDWASTRMIYNDDYSLVFVRVSVSNWPFGGSLWCSRICFLQFFACEYVFEHILQIYAIRFSEWLFFKCTFKLSFRVKTLLQISQLKDGFGGFGALRFVIFCMIFSCFIFIPKTKSYSLWIDNFTHWTLS